jgi:hypothetical protein
MRKWRAARFATICSLNWVSNEIFDEVMDIWKISSSYGDCGKSQMFHDKTTLRLKTDPRNTFLNTENRLIVFSSSSSAHSHTSTRLCYNIYRRLMGLSVPNFRIFEDFRGFWLGTSNIYPGCPEKNIYDFTIKIFFFKKSKIGHGGCTQNRILSTTTVTEFSKTFLVLYKWPDLTDVQVVLTSTEGHRSETEWPPGVTPFLVLFQRHFARGRSIWILIEVLFVKRLVKVTVFILLLFATLPECRQNQTAVSYTLRLLSDF